MKASLISIGQELVSGQCVDTNAVWLSQRLATCGIRVVRHVTVGDDRNDIRSAIEACMASCDLVIATGGLGPTADDITRYALSDAIGQPLEENADALARLRAMFERWQRPFHDANKVQALIPRGCRVIPNSRGTAPGMAFEEGARRLFVMPGVPAEMKAMFEEEVVGLLPSEAGSTRTVARRLLCFGISEARLGSLLADLMTRDRNPLVGTTASDAVITVRIEATGNSREAADDLLEKDVADIRRRLGRAVFGEEETTLAQVVAGMLTARGKTLATAESCTGGLLAKMLTDVPGSSDYFLRGYVTYSNESKRDLLSVSAESLVSDGAVSEAVARSMATGCRAASGSDFALAVTGIAGPGGGDPPEKPIGLVYIAMADHAGIEVKRMLFGEHLSRTEIRERSCKTALNLLRHRLLDL
ncbi:MAG: competence/damage-inducible protein A [Planctomycetes bacterium]|nr:competence/damage-inducible protein A [Planctomycetota bacterium]